jgi:hypothetical protein
MNPEAETGRAFTPTLLLILVLMASCSGPRNSAAEGVAVNSQSPESAASPPAGATAQKVEGDWASFWPAFRAAVRERDRAALKKVMAPEFGYGNGPKVSPDEVFRNLDDGGGKGWASLEKTLDVGTEPFRSPVSERPYRAAINKASCERPPCRYEEWALFELGADGRWRWTDLIFRGD